MNDGSPPDEELEELREMAENIVRTLSDLTIEEADFPGMDKIAKRWFYVYVIQELREVLNEDLQSTE